MKLIQDGKVTEQGERACELVYEHLTGKCWHKWEKTAISHDTLEAEFECKSCHKRVTIPNDGGYPVDWPPPLATSLDAWAEHIWPVMSDEQFISLWDALVDIINIGPTLLRDITPHHLLTAALELEVDCDRCLRHQYMKKDRDVMTNDEIIKAHKPCTCTNGRVKLKQLMEVE